MWSSFMHKCLCVAASVVSVAALLASGMSESRELCLHLKEPWCFSLIDRWFVQFPAAYLLWKSALFQTASNEGISDGSQYKKHLANRGSRFKVLTHHHFLSLQNTQWKNRKQHMVLNKNAFMNIQVRLSTSSSQGRIKTNILLWFHKPPDQNRFVRNWHVEPDFALGLPSTSAIQRLKR